MTTETTEATNPNRVSRASRRWWLIVPAAAMIAVAVWVYRRYR